MSMSKKDFIALADELRPIFTAEDGWNADSRDQVLRALCAFMRRQNPLFMEGRWLGYLEGTNGPGGGGTKKR